MNPMTATAIALVACLTCGQASAQTAPTPTMPALPGYPAMPVGSPDAARAAAQSQAMMATFEAAQSAAMRPGDERLSCAALEKEFTSILTDPALRSYMEGSAAVAPRERAAIQKAQGASTVKPNAAAATPAQAAANAAAAQRLQDPFLQSQQLTALMPKFMRAGHLVTLAAEKNCAWSTAPDGALQRFWHPAWSMPGMAGPQRLE